MILTITPNPSIDVSYYLEEFQVGGVYRCHNTVKTPGGKGLNVSKVLHLLGEEIIATGFIGGRNGNYIKDQLDQMKINHLFTPIHGETRTCIAISARGEITEVRENGPTVTEEDKEAFFESLSRMKNITTISLSGSLPNGLEVTFLHEVLAYAKDKKVIYDVSGDSLKYIVNESTIKPFAIKPNIDELAALMDKRVSEINPIEDIKKIEGIPLVVLSLGKDGAIAKYKDQIYECQVPTIEAVSPVGSGDSTIAGISYGLEHDLSIPDTLKLAMSLGVLNTLEEETGYVDISQLEKTKKQIIIKER
ncbi:MAG: hexose kinase [Tissierellia bacterium]|nr:hexose kinase [Tissierellia bacterium]